MTTQVVPGPVAPRDVTMTLNGSPQVLVAANPNRTHLQFQNNSGAMYYSYTNPLCAAGLTGCFQIGQGVVWAPTVGIPASAVYVNGTNGQLVVATEC